MPVVPGAIPTFLAKLVAPPLDACAATERVVPVIAGTAYVKAVAVPAFRSQGHASVGREGQRIESSLPRTRAAGTVTVPDIV